MTAPAVNQDVQYDAYGNPIKAKAPDPAKPALSLATGNQTAGNTTAYANVIPQTPDGAGNLLGKTIQPGPAVDRVGLAQSAWDKSTQASAPAYEASLQSAKQAAAGVGRLGSGMLRTRLGDLAMQRQQQMDTERSKLMNDAITGSISDQYQNIGIAQQQQGFQASQQAQDFQQALAAQQAALSTQLGVGQLGVSQQQADTARLGTTGNLALGQGQLGLNQQQLSQQGSQFGQTIDLQKKEQELNQLVATGQLTLAQKDQQLKELANQQQYGLAGSQLTLAQQAQQNQQKQFNDQLELQRADLTQKYGAATADRLIEAQKVQNQMSQFQQAQSQQGAQFGQSLAEQQAQRAQQGSQFGQQMTLEQKRADLERQVQMGQLDIAGANQALNKWQAEQQIGLAQSGQALQSSQFGQSLQEQIAQRIQSGQISQQEIGIKAQQLQQEAQLQGRSLSIQEAQNQAANQLAQQKIQQEGQQFGLSLAEQQASRQQSGQQFQQGFGLDQQKMELDRQVQMGQMSIAERDQRLREMSTQQSFGLEQQKLQQQNQQFGQSFSLEQQKAMLDEKVRMGQLTIEQASQELERARLAQQGQQFGMTLAEQQAARQQQGSQFTQGQAQDASQFNANLELQRSDLTQKYGAATADRMIEAQKVANQQSQFGQTLGQQNSQFGLTLAEQQAQRRQQDLQFGQSDLTTQRGQTIAQQGQQQEYLAKLAQILGITDIGALEGLLGTNFGMGSGATGSPYGGTPSGGAGAGSQGTGAGGTYKPPTTWTPPPNQGGGTGGTYTPPPSNWTPPVPLAAPGPNAGDFGGVPEGGGAMPLPFGASPSTLPASNVGSGAAPVASNSQPPVGWNPAWSTPIDPALQQRQAQFQSGDEALKRQYMAQYGANWPAKWGADQDATAAQYKAAQLKAGVDPNSFGNQWRSIYGGGFAQGTPDPGNLQRDTMTGVNGEWFRSLAPEQQRAWMAAAMGPRTATGQQDNNAVGLGNSYQSGTFGNMDYGQYQMMLTLLKDAGVNGSGW